MDYADLATPPGRTGRCLVSLIRRLFVRHSSSYDILSALVNIHYRSDLLRWRGYAYVIVVLPWGFPVQGRTSLRVPRLRVRWYWLQRERWPHCESEWCSVTAMNREYPVCAPQDDADV